ncbi:uncharacterized protein LOC144755510 [Lissotriton helveticus]
MDRDRSFYFSNSTYKASQVHGFQRVYSDGDFLLLDNPVEVLCKWLVENLDKAGRTMTEEREILKLRFGPNHLTDMQQLVKDSNDPSRFKDILVPKRKLHRLLEEAKAAQDSAGFLLNGVSEILSAKGLTEARA